MKETTSEKKFKNHKNISIASLLNENKQYILPLLTNPSYLSIKNRTLLSDLLIEPSAFVGKKLKEYHQKYPASTATPYQKIIAMSSHDERELVGKFFGKYSYSEPKFPLSIQDLINSENIPQLVHDGILDLSYQCLTSLEGLSNIPNIENIKELNLSHNQLTQLDAGVFSNLLELQALDLSFNKLIELDKGIFNNLPQLQELYLNDNRLSQLDAGTFDNLLKLETLNLSDNPLTQLTPKTFSNLSKLQSVDLYGTQLSDETTNLLKKNYPNINIKLTLF